MNKLQNNDSKRYIWKLDACMCECECVYFYANANPIIAMTLELQLQCQTPWNRKQESKTFSSVRKSTPTHTCTRHTTTTTIRCCGLITVIVVLPHNYSAIFLHRRRLFSLFVDAVAIVVTHFSSFMCVCVCFHLFIIFPRNVQLLLLFALLKMKVAISVKLCVMNCLCDHESNAYHLWLWNASLLYYVSFFSAISMPRHIIYNFYAFNLRIFLHCRVSLTRNHLYNQKMT